MRASPTRSTPSGLRPTRPIAAYITGQGVFVSTPGALPASQSPSTPGAYFTMKLDVTGHPVWIRADRPPEDRDDGQRDSCTSPVAPTRVPAPGTPGAFQPIATSNHVGCGNFRTLESSARFNISPSWTLLRVPRFIRHGSADQEGPRQEHCYLMVPGTPSYLVPPGPATIQPRRGPTKKRVLRPILRRTIP